MLSEPIRRALSSGHLIDITTTGRRTGEPRRIELAFQNIDGRIYVSGMPRPNRKRAWILNLEADPRMTLHLKGPVATADLAASARIITDPAERAAIMPHFATAWRRPDVEVMIAHSPLIEILVDGLDAGAAA